MDELTGQRPSVTVPAFSAGKAFKEKVAASRPAADDGLLTGGLRASSGGLGNDEFRGDILIRGRADSLDAQASNSWPSSRHEFAAGLNATSLQEEFAAELATIRGRVDSLGAQASSGGMGNDMLRGDMFIRGQADSLSASASQSEANRNIGSFRSFPEGGSGLAIIF